MLFFLEKMYFNFLLELHIKNIETYLYEQLGISFYGYNYSGGHMQNV